MPPVRRLLGTLQPIVALLVALAAATSASAATPSAVAAKRCHGTKAVVGGAVTCLKVHQRCKRKYRKDYLAVGLVCRKVVRRVHHHRRHSFRLKLASYAQRRHGETLALHRSGRPTFTQAKWLFDTVVAPLPGVRTPKGAVGHDESGTGALRSMERYRGRLTRAQTRALDRAEKPGTPIGVVQPDGTAQPVSNAARAAAGPGGLDVVAEAVRRLRGHGVVFVHPIAYSEATKNSGTKLAATLPEFLFNRGNDCSVTFYPKGLAKGAIDVRASITHELMHCADAEAEPSAAGWTSEPDWLAEGLPEFAAARVNLEWSETVGSTVTDWWKNYLDSPQTSLFTRTYSGLGFWSLVEHEGGNPFTLQPTLVRLAASGNPVAVYEQAVQAAGGDKLEEDWGPTLAGKTAFGPAWDLKGPGQTMYKEPDKGEVTEDSGPVEAAAYAGGANEFRFDVEADIVEVQGPAAGQGLLRDSEGADHKLDAQPEKFCTDEDGCECPDGTTLDYPMLPTGETHLGFSTLGDAEVAKVTGSSIEDECKSKTPRGVAVLGDSLIADFTKADCTKAKGTFTAVAKDSGYTLRVRISPFSGFKQMYDLSYGGGAATFRVSGPGAGWSNANDPGHNYPALGGINFNRKGTRMALGFASAFDPSINDHNVVGLGGALACKYPTKRK